MAKTDSPAKPPPKRLETLTLKVFIHCEGCRRKVRRIIRLLDGVEDVTVDSAIGKVTVTGNVDAKTVLQRLQKHGKHAEMWPSNAPAPAAAPPAPAAGNKAGANQPKPQSNNGAGNNNSNQKKAGNGGDGGDKSGDKGTTGLPAMENGSKKGDGKEAKPGAPAKGGAGNEEKPEKGKEVKPEEGNKASAPAQNGGGGGGGKKGGKKGGNANTAPSYGGDGAANSASELALPPPRVHDIPIMGPPNPSIEVSANRNLAPYDAVQTGYAYHSSAEYATHMFSDENANNCSIM